MIDNLRWFYRLLAGQRRYSAAVLAVMIAAAVAESLGLAMVLPLLTVLVDPAQGAALPDELRRLLAVTTPEILLALLVVAFIVKTALQVTAMGMSNHLAMRIRQRWTTLLLRRFLEQDYSATSAVPQGVVIQHVVQETWLGARAIMQVLEFVNRLVIAAVLTCLLLYIHPLATLIVAVAGATMILAVRWLSDRPARRFGDLRLALAQSISDNVTESIATVRQIKIFDLAKQRLRALNQALTRYTRAATIFSIFAELPYALTELLVLSVVAATLVVTFVHLEMTPNEVIPMIGFIALVAQRLITYVTFLVSQRTKLLGALPSLRLVGERIEADATAEQLDRGAPFAGLTQGIVFDQVGFRHGNGAEVLRGLDLRIDRGQTVAVIGPSGVGKSTLANLLLGLLRPTAGRLLVDGQPIESFSLRSLRQHFGYVAQEAELFHASIRENVMMGKPEASEAEFREAVRAAHVAEFADRLPDGYDTIVGDRGVKLSGGQRQRIAIARTLLRQPDLLIFDEATSALDRESEALIQQTIAEAARSRTVLIISHRMAVVRDADRIYRLTGDGDAVIVEAADLVD
jgi:subfamily B ATP-binding cassette protein MsbA